MDITNFIVLNRERGLSYGDYNIYHHQITKQISTCRKKLGIKNKRRAKTLNKDVFTAAEVAENPLYAHILLLKSERAWAHAQSIKASQAANSKDIAGRTRAHIISRSVKAARTAQNLVLCLEDSKVSNASTTDILEAHAYAYLMRGAAAFENQNWNTSLESYAVSRAIYGALATSSRRDIFKDLVSETIDPSVRYAAYQLKIPRTTPIPAIARKAFRCSSQFVVREITKLDPEALKEGESDRSKDAGVTDNAPKTITWRAREVKIEDAAIAVAWGSLLIAREGLNKKFQSLQAAEPKVVAAAYDEILSAAQDAVDATKHAIDELRAEGATPSDPRIQSLQITRTAVNFEMISWRIGRNRVLTGAQDGSLEDLADGRGKKSKTADSSQLRASRKVVRLKEKVALYDNTLQSFETVKELPGIAADEELARQLDAAAKYFDSLKCLSIARSHSLHGKKVNALALLNHALSLCSEAGPILASAPPSSTDAPPSIHVHVQDAKHLAQLLSDMVTRYRALVHIENLRKDEENIWEADDCVPLVKRLQDFPVSAVPFDHLVDLPPKLQPVSVKPIFLDIAWNYIDYPEIGKGSATQYGKQVAAQTQEQKSSGLSDEQPKKKGWFGFGR